MQGEEKLFEKSFSSPCTPFFSKTFMEKGYNGSPKENTKQATRMGCLPFFCKALYFSVFLMLL